MSVSHRFLERVLFLLPRAIAGVAPVPALALSTLLLSPALRAQEQAPAPPRPPAAPEPATPAKRKPPSASGEFAVGSSLWGPVSGIQDALWDAGLNDPGDGGFLGSQTVTYPRIHDFPERVSYWIAGRQRLGGGKWSVGFGAGITGLGGAEGYRAGPAGGDGVYVNVQSSAFSVAPMLWVEPAPVLRLGLGPAVHAVDVDSGLSDAPDVTPPNSENPIWRAGLLVEAALTLPAGKPFYVLLLGQYRWLADASVVVPRIAGPPMSVNVPLSHAFVAIGVGFRL
jgi:hypothetical protein